MSSAKKIRTNEEITASEVRLIGADGEQLGVVPIKEALEASLNEGLDLVEVAENATPPVCKIMDFGKYQFQQSKRLSAARKKQKQIHLKEIKFRVGTDVGDYRFKIRKLIQFLTHGDRTKVTIRFRGREMAHRDLGFELMERIKLDLHEHGTVEQEPKLDGRQMIMVLTPIKNKG